MGECEIRVLRNNLFASSFAAITNAKPENLCRRLKVIFQGEQALDYGGIQFIVALPSSSCLEIEI
jgi:E3 ubiquitin-protein ligase NEDD4